MSKIIIMSSTSDIDLDTMNHQFELLLGDSDGCILKWPEVTVADATQPIHPMIKYTNMKQIVTNCISDNVDLYILTFSEIIFNAVRVAIATANFDNGMMYQLCNDENGDLNLSIANIDADGRLTHWEHGIFDTLEISLDELLDLR